MSVLFENGEVRLLAIGFVLVMLVTGAVWQFRLSRVFSFLSASRLFRQPLVGLVLTFGFAVVLFQSGATKMRRSGGLSVGAMNGLAPRATEVISIEVSAAEELFAWNTNAVTNICWQGIQTSSNMLWLAVAWPSNAVLPDSALDLYAVDDLARCKATNAWAWIGRVAAVYTNGLPSQAIQRFLKATE